MDKIKEPAGFAPHNPTDGRQVGDWKSRYYGTDAISEIRLESGALVILFLLVPTILLFVWLGWAQSLLALTPEQDKILKPFIFSVCGGLLGGTIFSIKWLYHSVAKGLWNQDRRLWRMLTPLVSASLAFTVVVFMKSGLFSAFNPEAMKSGTLTFSLGFLVGYFSDTAIAKLAEIAQTLFGTASKSSDNNQSSKENSSQ